MDNLSETYLDAVRDLGRARGAPTDALILRCMVARDALARAIAAGDLADVRALTAVGRADDQLRAMGPRLAAAPQLPALRASLAPAPEAWWWYPLAVPGAGRARALAILAPVAVIALNGATLALLLDISGRFFYQGFDLLGAASIILPAILALAAVDGPLRAALGGAVGALLPPRSDVRALVGRVLVALAALLVAAVAWGCLPTLSRAYNDWGEQRAEAGELAAARQRLERAIRLDPTNRVAYYNLGVVQERLLLWDAALGSYRVAAEAGHLPAINNLAHLYLARQDYAAATQVLVPAQTALIRPDALLDDTVRYALLKNLGWARLGQARYPEALGLLQRAAALAPAPAAAHCLLGRLYAATERPAEAREAWQRCRAQARLDSIDDDAWLAEAAAYLDAPPSPSVP